MKIILTDKNKQNFKTKVTHKHQYYIETLYFVGKVLQIDYEIPALLRNEEEYRKKLKEVAQRLKYYLFQFSRIDEIINMQFKLTKREKQMLANKIFCGDFRYIEIKKEL